MIALIVAGIAVLAVIAVVVGLVDAAKAPAWLVERHVDRWSAGPAALRRPPDALGGAPDDAQGRGC